MSEQGRAQACSVSDSTVELRCPLAGLLNFAHIQFKMYRFRTKDHVPGGRAASNLAHCGSHLTRDPRLGKKDLKPLW